MISGRFKLYHLSRIRICNNDMPMRAPHGCVMYHDLFPLMTDRHFLLGWPLSATTLETTSYDRPYSTTCRLRLIVLRIF